MEYYKKEGSTLWCRVVLTSHPSAPHSLSTVLPHTSVNVCCCQLTNLPKHAHTRKNICQTVNLSNQTLVVSDISGVRENLFQSSRSPGFLVPNSKPHGTTWNRLEATSPKVIPACVWLLHTTPFSRTFYLTTCQT